MVKTVWKFDVALMGGEQQFLIPGDQAKPVLFAEQDGALRMWWEVQPYAPSKRERIVEIVGTGHPIPDGARHIGSVQQAAYVWHLYLVQ